MSVINILSENIILPISDLITGQSIYTKMRFLRQSQFWTREQIDDYQNDKLRQLVHHSFNNVPFYRDLFIQLKLKPEDIRTKKDLEKLPITTKEDFKKNKDKHIASNLNKDDLIFSSSSGSTGEPFQFYKTKQSESFMKAAAIRAWSWMGYGLGDKYVKVSMNPRTSLLKKIQDKLNNCLYLSATQLTPAEFRLIHKEISEFSPLFIRCYPVPLQFLAQQIYEMSHIYQGNSLKAINTTGSTIHNKERIKIENVFNVKIYDSYSCEGGTVFSECPTRANYHPAEEYAISEFIVDKYTESDKDKPVRHITTDLHNYASPFIRYDSQDYLVLGKKKLCSCGRHLLNVSEIRGRDSDILKTPSGKYLIVENFVAYFEWIKEVDQIQVVQEELNKIIINLVVNNEFNNVVLKNIQNYWDEYIGNDVVVIVKIVEEIKLTPTGKRRTVIRNPKLSLDE